MTLAAYVVWRYLPEPPRSGEKFDSGSPPSDEETASFIKNSGQDDSRGSIRSALQRWSGLLRLRTFWLLMLQGIPGCVPWGVIITFLPDYLHVDTGLTVHEATVVMGFLTIGQFAGNILGSEAGQRLYNINPRLPPLLMVTAGTLGVAPFWILIRHTPSSALGRCALAAIGGTLASTTGPNARATLSNVTESRQRGVAFASFILFDDVGKGAGPMLVAALVRTYGRRTAFSLAMLNWIPCAALCGMTAFTVSRDQRKVASNTGMKSTDN